MRVKMYSTGCPKCNILEKKLEQKNIKYEICEDVGEMINLGIQTVPVLEVDGNLLQYNQAVNYINTLELED